METVKFSHNGLDIIAGKDVLRAFVLNRLRDEDSIRTPSFYRDANRPAIGELWNGEGGIYLGDITAENGLPGGPVIGCITPAGLFSDIAYGQYGTEVEGVKWKRNGRANTEALAKAGNEFAKQVLGLEIESFKDWHWPAQYELNLGCINGSAHYKDEAYWSSTQDARYYARFQNFSTGLSHWDGKGSKYSCFVVRRVIL